MTRKRKRPPETAAPLFCRAGEFHQIALDTGFVAYKCGHTICDTHITDKERRTKPFPTRCPPCRATGV